MKLTKKTVELEMLFIDPNNPRFADISDESLNIPQIRFTEDEIQKHAFNKMMNPHFDVLSLANSIETVGFIPVDYIVAKEINDGKYVIIEGNRRLAALKYIVNNIKLGQSLLKKDDISKFEIIEILVVDNLEDEKKNVGKIIQGIRNVSGIKEWEAYQKAQYINLMIDNATDPITISRMIGMPVKDINRYYKTYSAMTQFKLDAEYGSKWKHSYFSYFDEVLKRPILRTYFGWDKESYKFLKVENLHRFYDWIIPNEEGISTFSDARDIRQLVDLVDDEKALNFLDDQALQKAITYFNQKYLNLSKISLSECRITIDKAITAFKKIVGEGLEKELSQEDIDELSKNIDEMKNQVNRIKRLKQDEA